MMEHILLDMEEGVATLTLNRPRVHNVVGQSMMHQWNDALNRIETHNDIHSVILTAAGDRTFCAGGDLTWFTQLTEPADVRAMSEAMQALLDRLYNGPLPVIAAVNGSAYGGGCELLTACHYRIAVAGAGFQFRQSAMGVITGWGGGERVLRQLGRRKALELLLGGARINSETALHMGLIDRIVAPEELMQEARAFAALVAGRSPASIQSFLELARFVEHNDHEAIRQKETDLFVDCWQGPWFRKAVDDFLARKKD